MRFYALQGSKVAQQSSFVRRRCAVHALRDEVVVEEFKIRCRISLVSVPPAAARYVEADRYSRENANDRQKHLLEYSHGS
jgi:hypothetical protein